MLLLIFNFISPIQGAKAAVETVTKTFNVKGFDDTNYQGATIRIYWYDDKDQAFFTDLVTTGADGSASIVVPKNAGAINGLTWVVMPPVTDLDNAIASSGDIRIGGWPSPFKADVDETINVKLEKAKVRVAILNPDESPVVNSLTDTGSIFYIFDPNAQNTNIAMWANLNRAGAFGLSLGGLNAGSDYTFGLLQAGNTQTGNRFSWRYPFKFTNANPSVVTIYEDASKTTTVSKVSDYFPLHYKKGNLSGCIRDNSNNCLTFTDPNLNSIISITPENASGINVRSNFWFTSTGNVGPNWFAYLPGANGRYKVSVAASGSLALPSFNTEIWKSDSGFSLTQGGSTSPAVNGVYTLDLQQPTPDKINLKVNVVEKGTNTPLKTYLSVFDTTTKTALFSPNSSNGVFSAVVPTGNYTLSYTAINASGVAFATSNLEVTVDGSGVLTIASQEKNNQGVYVLSPVTNNFRAKSLNAAGEINSKGWFRWCKTSDNTFSTDKITQCGSFGVDQTGVGSTALADGFYLATIFPGTGGTEASATYQVTVANGTASGTELDAGTGIFLFKTQAPNISGNVKVLNNGQESNLVLTGQQNVTHTLQIYRTQGGGGYYQDVQWSYGSTYAFRVTEPAQYRIITTPENIAGLTSSISQKITYATSPAADFSLNGQTCACSSLANDNPLKIVLQSPNVKIKVVSPVDGNPLLSGAVSIFSVVGNSDTWIQGYGIWSGMNGLLDLPYLAPGNYRISVDPQGALGLSVKKYKLTVDNAGVATFEDQSITFNAELSRFVISAGKANIEGQVIDENNAPLLPSNGKTVQVSIQFFSTVNNNWEWLPDGTQIDGSGNFGLSLNTPGQYRIYANPFGFDNLGAAYGTEFSINADGKFVIANNVVDSLTGANGIKIKLYSSNFKILLTDPSGNPMSGWVSVAKINDDGSQNWVQNIDLSQSGLGGAKLANGKYRLDVNSSNSSFAKSVYQLEILDQSITLTKNGTAVPPVAGRFTLSPGLANLTGTVLGTNGTAVALDFSKYQWVSLNLQKYDDAGKFWQWTNDWTGADATGNYSFSVTTNGTYRVLAIPNGLGNASSKTSAAFTFDGTKFTGAATTGCTDPCSSLSLNIQLESPNFKILLVDPVTKSPLTQGWISVLKDEGNGSVSWVTNMDISPSSAGKAYASLADGTYRLEVNTNLNGYSRSIYNLVVSASGSNIALNIDQAPNGDGFYELAPATPNITGRILNSLSTPLGSSNNGWVSINLQSARGDGNWDWTDNWANTNRDGYFAMSVSKTGTYRLRIEPNGFAGVSVSYSGEFTVTAEQLTQSNKWQFGDIKLAAPTLMVKVVADQNSETPIPFVGIELRKNGNWIDWIGTGPQGLAAINFKETGNYQLIAYPGPIQVANGASKKSYELVVGKNDANALYVKEIYPSGGTSANSLTAKPDGSYLLALGSGNVKGVVKNPTDQTVGNVPVVARNVATNQDLWEYSANTSADGKWSMSLPDGQYKILAIAPWGSTLYGNSDPSATVTVTGGVASGGGGNPTAMTLSLKAPNWTGTIKTPDGNSVVPYASIMLYTNGNWNWANSNANGEFALSAADFTDFSDDAFLEIRDDRNGNYPMKRITGKAAVTAAIGLSGNSILQFDGSNLSVNVKAGASNAQYIWVNIDADNVGWLGGGMTNKDGIASFNIDKTKLTPGNFRIRAELNNNPALGSTYTSTTKTLLTQNVADAITANTANYTLDLDTPNFRAQIKEPTGSTASFAWIELFEADTGKWVAGTGADQNGSFSLSVLKPGDLTTTRYTVKVNPSWNSTTFSSNQYTLTATKDGLKIYPKDKDNVPADEILSVANIYPLQLASPSVTGKVVNTSNTGVRDSWVVARNVATGEYLWQYGANTKNDGSFAMSLPNGDFEIEANVPWNSNGLAKSSACAITVENSSLKAGASCASGNGVQLSLRAPNLSFTLKKPTADPLISTIVPFANVGMCIVNWCAFGQSNNEGVVSMFVDKEAINKQTYVAAPGSPEIYDINIWVDPPWGTSDIVRWNCLAEDNVELCKDISKYNKTTGFTTVLTSSSVVLFGKPNLTLTIQEPSNTNPLPNAWVNLFNTNGSWIGGSNSSNNGTVSFNVKDSDLGGNFKLEINPPWNSSSQYSRITYGNSTTLQFADLNGKIFKIGSPNVLVIGKDSSATPQPNKWGWISLEELNPASGEVIAWLNGSSLDSIGQVALTLEADKKYRVWLNPGSGIAGARVSCIFTTDAAVDLTYVSGDCVVEKISAGADKLTINLSAGNVTGYVKYSGNAVAGAIVYAVPVIGGNPDKSQSVTATSGADGKFGFNLDRNISLIWEIKVFPVNQSGQTQLADKTDVSMDLTGTNPLVTYSIGDINLVAKA